MGTGLSRLFLFVVNECEHFIKYWLKNKFKVLLKISTFLRAFPYFFS